MENVTDVLYTKKINKRNQWRSSVKYYIYVSQDIFNQEDILDKIKKILIKTIHKNKEFLLKISKNNDKYIVNVSSLKNNGYNYKFKGILHI